jgi:hypothetical protein
MIPTLRRRDVLLGLAASALPTLRALAGAPAGSSRYLIEVLVFRQPGPLPRPVRAAPIPGLVPIPGRVEGLPDSAQKFAGLDQALSRRGYAIIAHTAWAAIVPANGRTTARLEDLLREGAPLSGTVALQRGQHLMLGVEIDYHAGDTFALREKRRIKFGERHYFDHAAFGVIAQVTPAVAAATTED